MGGASDLIKCSTCDRKFNEKALVRHENICVKVFKEKRKAFDMKEQRKATDANGTGVEEQEVGSKTKKPKQPRGASKKKQPAENAKEAGTEKKIPKWKL